MGTAALSNAPLQLKQRTVRREFLKQADVHTLLRLVTGSFYIQGVKANVLFFDRKPAEKPWTERLWISAARTVWWVMVLRLIRLLHAVRLCPKMSWTLREQIRIKEWNDRGF